jgi:hypothetical protein
MPGELLPPAELAPPIPHETTFQERLDLWVDLMNTCEQFLLARLRREIGPDGDLEAAYRRWYEQRCEEHEQDLIRMAQRFTELRQRNG